MSAARHQNDILQMFYGEIPAQVNRRLLHPLNPRVEIEDVFFTSQNNYNEWLRVWKMIVSERNPHDKDLFEFAKATKESFTQLIKKELKELKNIKVSLELKVKFIKEEEEEQTKYMEQYFRENEPQVFNASDDENQIEDYFDNVFERINEKIEAWVAEGSGWEVEKIELVDVNIARFQPLRGGIYLPIPKKLKNKKAIMNVQNKDNECLKWAVRSAMFPPPEGKNPNRPSSYPVNDGIDWSGIVFPTPVKQIDRLEAQNKGLAINVFGWENDCVIVHRISKKEKCVPRINLMLIESGAKQHYCFVKRVKRPTLRPEQTPRNKTLLHVVLNRFFKRGLAGKPQKILQWPKWQTDKD